MDNYDKDAEQEWLVGVQALTKDGRSVQFEGTVNVSLQYYEKDSEGAHWATIHQTNKTIEPSDFGERIDGAVGILLDDEHFFERGAQYRVHVAVTAGATGEIFEDRERFAYAG